MAFKMTGPLFFGKRKNTNSNSSLKIVREKLDDGILGEAENGNIIKVDTSIKPGSKKEKEVVAHEKFHQDEMDANLLKYDEHSVTDNIAKKTYTRKEGKLIDNETGEVFEEGDKKLPHEKRAWIASNKAKNA